MINKILGTIGARLFSGIVLLLILGLHSKYLGVAILGQLAVFRLAATINHLFASVFSGPAIVYLGNRISVNKLVIPTIFWVIGCTFILSVVQIVLHLIPSHYFYDLILFSLMLSSQTFFEQTLLIKQKVKEYNLSSFIYHSVLIISTLVLIHSYELRNERTFFIASYIAMSSSLVFLFFASFKQFSIREFSFRPRIAFIIFNYGFWVQVNNFIQTMNYRFSLLALDHFWGKTAVGFFSAALQLAEAIWIIAKSLATVQYARISSNKSKQYAMDLTLLMSKASFFASLAACLFLLILPESFIVYYLGSEFHKVKYTITLLLPGILFFSVSLIYCHYYSGIGQFFMNSIGSIISLVIIVIGGLLIIPSYGVQGAAFVNSAGLAGMWIYYFILLTAREKTSVASVFPAKNDIKRSIKIVRDYLKV